MLTLIAMLSIGCAALTTDRRDYAAGDTIGLALANHGTSALNHDACGAALQRRDGGARWAFVGDGEQPPDCSYVCVPLRIGKVIRDTFLLPGDLTAGEYRVIFWIYWHRPLAHPGSRLHSVAVASNGFRVR